MQAKIALTESTALDQIRERERRHTDEPVVSLESVAKAEENEEMALCVGGAIVPLLARFRRNIFVRLVEPLRPLSRIFTNSED